MMSKKKKINKHVSPYQQEEGVFLGGGGLFFWFFLTSGNFQKWVCISREIPRNVNFFPCQSDPYRVKK